MNGPESISTSRIAELLVALSEDLAGNISLPVRNLLLEAANRLLSQKSEMVSLYRKIAEIESITYKDIDHGGEIK